jgi:hypothetical protein
MCRNDESVGRFSAIRNLPTLTGIFDVSFGEVSFDTCEDMVRAILAMSTPDLMRVFRKRLQRLQLHFSLPVFSLAGTVSDLERLFFGVFAVLNRNFSSSLIAPKLYWVSRPMPVSKWIGLSLKFISHTLVLETF